MPTSITSDGTLVTFTNTDAIFQIDASGQTVQLKVLGNEQELYLPNKGNNTFASVIFSTPSGEKSSNSNNIIYSSLNQSLNEGILEVHFPDPISIFIRCKAEADHFLFTLDQVQSTNPVIAVAFLQVIFPCHAYGGLMPALVKDHYLIAQVPLNADSHVFSTSMSNDEMTYAMQSIGFSAVRLKGVQTALLVCHQDQWLDRMEALTVKYQLPHPTIQGIWDKKHPDTKTSYLFVDLDLKNHKEVIGYAQKGGFGCVMPYCGTWAENIGSYEINLINYQGKLCKLQEVAENLHAEGLKLGLHVMSFMVEQKVLQDNPDWINKLGKSPASLSLHTPISEKEYMLPVADSVEKFKAFLAFGGKYLRIGNEALLLDSVLYDPPRLVLAAEMVNNEWVRKSQLYTSPSAHDAETVIYQLPDFFGTFLADPHTDLPDLIAQKFAHVYKEVGADFAFLDGDEGTRALLPLNVPWSDGWYWYASAQVANRYRAALAGTDALLESSAMNENLGYTWFVLSRGNSGDYAYYAPEAWMDHSRIARYRNKLYAQVAFPQELGWIALLAKVMDNRTINASFAATTLDEIEHQMNRALGFDLPISLESNVEEIQANKFSDNIFSLIGKYEFLRLNFQLPADLKAKLQGVDQSFAHLDGYLKEQYHLVSMLPTGKCTFRKQVYLQRVMSPGEKWTFDNPFAHQPLKVKITALPGHTSSVSNANCILFEEMDGTFCEIERGSGIASPKPDQINNIRIEYGNLIVKGILPANQYLPAFKWCGFRKEFANFIDLSEHKVIDLEAEVDATGVVVCLHLFDDQGIQRLFQFEMDTIDSKHMTFEIPTSTAFFAHKPLTRMGNLFRGFNWSKVKGVEIFVKNILTPISLKISSVKALKQSYSKLENPTISLAGKKITFSTQLYPREVKLGAEPWDYLVYAGGTTFSCFDGNNKKPGIGLNEPITTSGPGKLLVKSGSNAFIYKHIGVDKALVQILLEGENDTWICKQNVLVR